MVCQIDRALSFGLRTSSRPSVLLGLLFAVSLFAAGQPVLPGCAFAPSQAVLRTVGPAPDTSDIQSDSSQGEPTLHLGERFKRELKGGERQSFKLSVGSGQYARLLIEQYGIILEATLFDSRGNRVVEMDNPSGGYGPIYISAFAEMAGDYRLELRSNESWANPGRAEVMIEELREALAADHDRIAGELAFAEGRRLFKQETKESRQAALKRYEEAFTYWERLADVHWRVMTLYSIGSTYRRLGDLGQALQYFGKGLDEKLRSKLKQDDWRLIASILNDRGFAAADFGDEAAAFESLNKALRLYQDHGDKRGEASAFTNIGYTHQTAGRIREAIENYEKALPLRRSENDQAREFNVLINIGAAYSTLGEPLKALESCKATLEVWQELDRRGQLNNRDRLAIGFNNTAAAYDKLGEWEQAREYYARALAIFQKSGNTQGEAAALDNIGQLRQVLGDPAAALEYYGAALQIIQKTVKDPKAEANVLTHIGQVHIAEGKLSEALDEFKKARAIPQSPQREAETLTNMGIAYSLQNNQAEALRLFDEALVLRRRSQDLRGEALTLQKKSEALRLTGNQSQALEDLNRALSLWTAVRDRRGEAETLLSLARVARDLNHLAEAIQKSEDAIKIIESLRTKVSSEQLRTSYFATQQSFYELGIELNMRLYHSNRAPQHLSAALEASEKSRARSLIDSLGKARTNITEEASPDLLRQVRVAQQRLNAKSEAQTKFLSQKRTEKQADDMAREVSQLIAEYDEIRDRIRAASPKYSQLTQPQPLTLSEIQQQLDDDTLLLEYSLGEKRGYMWAVTPDSISGFELPGREKVEAVAHRVSAALTARNRQEKNETGQQWTARFDRAQVEYEEASAALSKMVLDPVASMLGQKRLVIVADGALQVVPFTALPAPRSVSAAQHATAKAQASARNMALNKPRLLINDHEIISLPSASVLAVQRRELAGRKPAPLAVAVLADPVFDDNDERVRSAKGGRVHNESAAKQTPPLSSSVAASSVSKPQGKSELTRALEDIGGERVSRLLLSADEARSIIKGAPKGEGMAALGFDASRVTATSPELAKYRIIHFATHGVMNLDHPELSGIVLSMVDEKGQPQDGYLRLHEIYNLNLPAELVVLSACQTGVGKQIKGEGLIALTRGFMYAGAPRVVASLWKVDDAATAELMAEFYKQMFTNRLKPAAALRTAQLKLAQQKRWRSPYYWAGFVLQGEWK